MNLFLILLVIIISSVEFCGGWVIAPICGAMLKNRYHISTAATTSLVQRAPSFQFVGLHHCNDWLGRQCTAGHLARNRKNAHFYPNFRSTHVDLTQPVDQPPLLDHVAPGKTIENTVKRWKTGLLLALAGALWVCCSSKYFTIGFACIAYLAHQEYVKMMHKMDIQPAILTSRIFSILFVASALWYPMLIPPLLTTSFLALVIAHLTRNDRKPLATDIFSSIFGTMYLGYLPSYWIILHGIKLPSQSFQLGKLLTVWTLMVVIAADAGGYFIGRSFGKRKLGTLSYAAGIVSPNKTIEGLIGGIAFSSITGLLGAYLLNFPSWQLFGGVYGIVLSISSILGDLLASALKRSANVKDSGNLLPGHGGVLDRLDSHLISGAVAVHLLYMFGLLR